MTNKEKAKCAKWLKTLLAVNMIEEEDVPLVRRWAKWMLKNNKIEKENHRLRLALQEIYESHVPDQPVAYGFMSREDWAYKHVGRLRGIAGKALNPEGMKAKVV